MIKLMCSDAPDTLAPPPGASSAQPIPGSVEELDAICAKVDALNEGSEEDREEAMRILQDNELNVNVSFPPEGLGENVQFRGEIFLFLLCVENKFFWSQ